MTKRAIPTMVTLGRVSGLRGTGGGGDGHEAEEEDVEGGDAGPAGHAQPDKDEDGDGKGDEVGEDVEARLGEVEDGLVDTAALDGGVPEVADGSTLEDGCEGDGNGAGNVEDVEAVDDVAESALLPSQAQ